MLGPGTLSVTSSNTYSGGATLSAGRLNINNAAALGSGRFTISGGTVGNTSGAAITLSSSNAQTWNGNFTFAGSNDLNLGSGAVSMSSSRTVTVASNNLTIGGAISGSGYSLTKAGTGTLTLGSASTYGGATAVSGGTLALTPYAGPIVANWSFETPNLSGGYQYNPHGGFMDVPELFGHRGGRRRLQPAHADPRRQPGGVRPGGRQHRVVQPGYQLPHGGLLHDQLRGHRANRRRRSLSTSRSTA